MTENSKIEVVIKVISALYEELLGISGQFFCGYN